MGFFFFFSFPFPFSRRECIGVVFGGEDGSIPPGCKLSILFFGFFKVVVSWIQLFEVWVSSLSFFGEGGFNRSFVLLRILGLDFVGGVKFSICIFSSQYRDLLALGLL